MTGTERFWTNRDEERLIALLRQGLTDAAVGARLGRSRWAVQARKRLLERQGRLPRGPRSRRATTPGRAA